MKFATRVGNVESSVLARLKFCKDTGNTTGSCWSVAGVERSKLFRTTFVTLVWVEMTSEPKVTLATLLFTEELVLVPPTITLSHPKTTTTTATELVHITKTKKMYPPEFY